MPENPSYHRYRAEADFALSRLRVSREAGDAARAEQWHATWSLSEAAADAEQSERGGGARLLRRKVPPPLRPPPETIPPLSVPSLPIEDTPEPPVAAAPAAVPPDPLDQALARHARIEAALRDGGPNPFPDEMDEGEWQYHLTAFRVGGPYDCDLLQKAEEAVEAIVEFRPEFWGLDTDEEPAQALAPTAQAFESAVLPECVRIYRESLADLTEEELRGDLETCLAGNRQDTAGLIEAELLKRERETGPDLGSVDQQCTQQNQRQASRRKTPPTVAPPSDARPNDNETPDIGVVAERRGPCTTRLPSVATQQARRERSGPRKLPTPAGEEATEPAAAVFTTAPAWIDTSGRTRTWSLFDPSGEKLAEIATKRDAEKLAALLNTIKIAGGTFVR